MDETELEFYRYNVEGYLIEPEEEVELSSPLLGTTLVGETTL